MPFFWGKGNNTPAHAIISLNNKHNWNKNQLEFLRFLITFHFAVSRKIMNAPQLNTIHSESIYQQLFLNQLDGEPQMMLLNIKGRPQTLPFSPK